MRTANLMYLVLIACVPAWLTLMWFFGWGYLINVIWACAVALTLEHLLLRLRNIKAQSVLLDGSALLTAVLLALALPAACPWWMTLLGVAFALLIGKHLFGGLGHNLFNPSMVGYAVLLVSFPIALSTWPATTASADFITALKLWLELVPMADALTAPTALELTKFREGLTISELQASTPYFGKLGWGWVNVAFLVAGLGLLYLRVFSWHAPVGMLISLAACALVFYDGGSSESYGSPALHLFSGATMMGAFFIVTDPVTGASGKRGQLLFGLGTGVLVFAIRAFGGYPDGVAFAVLIMNMVAPLMDRRS